MQTSVRNLLVLLAAFVLAAAACGDGGDDQAASEPDAGTEAAVDEAVVEDGASDVDSDAAADDADVEDGDRPTVVVTTNILGDVVANLVGDEVDVVTVMPVGADPHSFQPSAQQVDLIASADVLIANGGGFEEGLLDIIEAAEGDGVATFEALGVIEVVEYDDEDRGDEDHGDEKADGDGHDHSAHGPDDPHFFTDPARMAIAAQGIADFLVGNVEGIDASAIEANSAAYIAEIEAVDAEVEDLLAVIPAERRVLVTNHEVFGYFADRYGFEVVGTIIPGGSTTDGVSAQALADLAAVIEEEGVPAIFGDTSSTEDLANTLADEVGSIAVVEVYSESLGEEGSDGATYLDMVRSNAQRIADALAG